MGHPRPRGKHDQAWEDKRVAARTVLQGGAILNRLGYETDLEASRKAQDLPDPLAPAAPANLRCHRCNYILDGVLVRAAQVTCPECGFGQVVMAWQPFAPAQGSALARAVVLLLAIVGGLALFIVAIGMIGIFS